MEKQTEDAYTGQKGLTTVEAGLRLKQYGKNTVTTKKRVRPLVEFLKKFNSPLLMILIVAAIISFFVGQQTNAAILLVMVLLSVVLDFVNSYRSQKAVDALAARVVTKAKVYRDGQQCDMALQWIVPGDVVFLTAGDVVPADCRVLESKDFFCNQSVLTGESVPVEKTPRADSQEPSVLSPESHDRIFLGTSVVTGYAYALVERNGQQTEFGKIARRLLAAEPETDFERGIRQFSVFIMRVTFFLVGFVFIINAVVGRGWFSSFLFAIAIAIGLTPELLPVILSVSLARGAMRMLKNGVIVKHLPAIQSFGSMNVLCTDKTGTLTENRIAVVKYTDVWGKTSEDVLHKSYLNSAMHTGVPNPLDKALKEYRTWDMTGVEKIDEIPFDFERRRSSIAVALQHQHLLITQGAPEDVLAICTTYQENGQSRPLTADITARVQQQFQVLSMDGFKVLAVAVKDVNQQHAPYTIAQENAMTLLGFVSFLDPAKVTVKPTLQDLERYGIEIKIITGDHELLTEKICKDIELPVRGMLKGSDVEAMSDQELQRRAVGTTIFSRVTPETKERIVTQLRKAGKVVGYLGDGINDAPALRAADVGVSVSNAVDVAKGTADIILVHKSLRVLKEGVIEGRKTFLNTMKYVKMGLSSNFGNMLSMMYGGQAILCHQGRGTAPHQSSTPSWKGGTPCIGCVDSLLWHCSAPPSSGARATSRRRPLRRPRAPGARSRRCMRFPISLPRTQDRAPTASAPPWGSPGHLSETAPTTGLGMKVSGPMAQTSPRAVVNATRILVPSTTLVTSIVSMVPMTESRSMRVSRGRSWSRRLNRDTAIPSSSMTRVDAWRFGTHT